MKRQIRIGALLLAFAMAFSLLTSSALATETTVSAAPASNAALTTTEDTDAFICTASVSKPKATKLTRVKTVSTSKLKATWKKVSSVTGYQVQYSTSSRFTKAKTSTVKSYKTTSKTISGLSKNKKYYVRVRTFKTTKKKNYYSAWSKAKSAKTDNSSKSSSKTVYYTSSGKCYHRRNCATLKRSKHVKSTSRSTAKAKGLSACKVCKP